MASPESKSSIHLKQYLAARDFFDEHPETCFDRAGTMLQTHELSRGLRIRTLILAASATDDWYIGEVCIAISRDALVMTPLLMYIR